MISSISIVPAQLWPGQLSHSLCSQNRGGHGPPDFDGIIQNGGCSVIPLEDDHLGTVDACRGLAMKRYNFIGLSPHNKNSQRYGIDTDIEKRPSRQFGIEDTVLRIIGKIEGKIRFDSLHRSQFSLINPFSQLFECRKEPAPHGFHQKEPLLFSQFDKRFELIGIDGNRFLAENMLSMSQSQFNLLAVIAVRIPSSMDFRLSAKVAAMLPGAMIPHLILFSMEPF